MFFVCKLQSCELKDIVAYSHNELCRPLTAKLVFEFKDMIMQYEDIPSSYALHTLDTSGYVE